MNLSREEELFIEKLKNEILLKDIEIILEIIERNEKKMLITKEEKKLIEIVKDITNK